MTGNRETNLRQSEKLDLDPRGVVPYISGPFGSGSTIQVTRKDDPRF